METFMRLTLLAVFASALAVTACQTKPKEAQIAPSIPSARDITSVVSWGCDDGTVFSTAFKVGDEDVELAFPDGTKITLPHAVSGSGARYADAQHEFWNKGED